MANKQHAQFSDENGNIYYLENQTEDVLDPSGKPLSDGGDLSEASVTFTADSTRTLPKSGSRFKAFCGSVLKFLSDLKTVSFSGSYNDLSNKPSIPSGAAASQAVANNCTTTAAGSVLDARQGKVLMDKANQLNSEISSMKQSFQAGVDTIYNKMVSCGETPSSKSPTDIANKIQQMYDGRYGTGYSIGYNEGRTQGQNDVKGNPNNYGLYSKSQYDQNYNNGYNAGFSAGEAAASYSVEDISSKLTGYASQNHGFRSTESLSSYKYIVVCATYQAGKTASFSSFSGCSCVKQVSWSAKGDSTDNVSAHLVVLTNITGVINVSASSSGTGNHEVKAFGFK